MNRLFYDFLCEEKKTFKGTVQLCNFFFHRLVRTRKASTGREDVELQVFSPGSRRKRKNLKKVKTVGTLCAYVCVCLGFRLGVARSIQVPRGRHTCVWGHGKFYGLYRSVWLAQERRALGHRICDGHLETVTLERILSRSCLVQCLRFSRTFTWHKLRGNPPITRVSCWWTRVIGSTSAIAIHSPIYISALGSSYLQNSHSPLVKSSLLSFISLCLYLILFHSFHFFSSLFLFCPLSYTLF